jgi:hypothetical protein
VELLLTSIYRKLGITRRAELADVLHEDTPPAPGLREGHTGPDAPR